MLFHCIPSALCLQCAAAHDSLLHARESASCVMQHLAHGLIIACCAGWQPCQSQGVWQMRWMWSSERKSVTPSVLRNAQAPRQKSSASLPALTVQNK